MLRLLPVAVVAASFPAQAGPLHPSGKWVVDWSESQCVAYRKYGEGDAASTFMVKPSSSGETLQIIIAEAGNIVTTEQYDVALETVGANSGKVRSTVLRFYNTSTKLRYFSATLPQQEAGMLNGATTLSIAGMGFSRQFELEQMGAVIASLNQCTDDLQQTWHIGSKWDGDIAQAAATKRPLDQYLRDYDYPQIAVDKAQDGTLDFMLLIDEKGEIRNCMIEKSTGFAILDVIVCSSVTNRAKFNPARDRAGAAVKGSYHGRVSFQWNGSGYVW